MRIFITGGSGFVGGGIIKALVTAGHSVTSLARSAESAARVERLGAVSVRGDLADPDTYRKTAAQHDALIHAAFDYSVDEAEGLLTDRTALDALLSAAHSAEHPCHVIYTSSAFLLGDLSPVPLGEEAVVNPAQQRVNAWRFGHEARAAAAATENTLTAVVRVGMVYGGRGGLMSELFACAASGNEVPYVGQGANRYPMVHVDDLAALYRLIIERGASGIFHGVDGLAVSAKDVALAVSRSAGADNRVRGLSADEARRRWGNACDTFSLDVLVDAPRARALGWQPKHSSFVESARAAYREWCAGV